MKQFTVVTGTVGMDAHCIGTKILSRVLREEKFKVIELGVLTPPEDFIKASQESDADAILISSLYGMAELDLKGFKEKCIEAGLGDVLLYLGGNLAVGRHEFEEDEKKFKAMGFDRVYPPDVELTVAVADLKKDLQGRERGKKKDTKPR
jgi:methylaspartate mutase S subunit